ncbi:hypothetical protein Asulf_01176 [Archaeoglobus sulfaticallidus PM70-1]|uniref:Uncharacterized protein n=1 Tax=Archaeoglobus sulfaticallidus PM70-1 TaxID=387631 RepID=N0BLR3_9EURY|nr:hypothetical protein [Archaeoglobus sulfaticallidus]AGK61175.1 hypothetical protein Asulf_01176 [Archaeoglobus sulfaticallidus PM70-1]
MNVRKDLNSDDLHSLSTNHHVVFASSKKIKEEEIHHTTISEKRDIEKIKSIIARLPDPKERALSEIRLRTNPRKWVISLLEEYPDNIQEEVMEALLNDFSDSLQTRMREENKYAILILFKNELVLCHSIFGEETISPEWKTIPRMLDSDNVLRYIRFVNAEDTIKVKYYERWATESFVDWLGLPHKEAFYHFGGKYRIQSKIDDIDIVFELTEEEISRWIEKHPEIKEGKIVFSTPITYLPITQIWVGKKKYENIGDFIQDLIAERYDIEFYRKKFREIVSVEKMTKEEKPGPLELYLHKFFDEKDKVIKFEDGEYIPVVEKKNLKVDILFVCRNIEIRSSYFDDILGRFINGEEINIIHAGMRISPDPLKIKNLNIWSEIVVPEFIDRIIEYYSSVNLQDKVTTRILEFVIFKTLAKSNVHSHLYYFLEPFAERIMRELSFDGRLTKLEDQILEFKPQEFFSGKDDEIVQRLCSDLTTKLKSSKCKVYLLGVEDDGTFNPIPSSRLKSDRVEKIRNNIQKLIRKELPDYNQVIVYAMPVIYGDKGILIIFSGAFE